MKHSTPQLLKFQRLQRRLGETKRGLVGLLELLWHGTATQAPQGDIGKFSNEEIAILVDWEGDHDQLVDALVETGWLDRCSKHRLVVHDWSQHAPNWVRMLVKKRALLFSEASAEASTEGSAEASQEASTEASAEGTPNLTKPNLTNMTPNGVSDVSRNLEPAGFSNGGGGIHSQAESSGRSNNATWTGGRRCIATASTSRTNLPRQPLGSTRIRRNARETPPVW